MTLLWVTFLIKSKPFSCIFKLVMHFYSFNEQDVKWCHWYLGKIYFLDLFSLSYKILFSIIFFPDIFKSSNDLCKIHVFLSSYNGNWIFSKCKWVALNLHIYNYNIHFALFCHLFLMQPKQNCSCMYLSLVTAHISL